MPKILTACQATSNQLHIGNYFGAIKPLMEGMQDPDNQFLLFVVDLHSITKILTIQDKPDYTLWTRNLVKLYIACGVDVNKTLIFKQSDVPAHTQLTRVLSCFTHIGFMQRMHGYKDAEAKNELNLMSIGSMNYPVLMAADILLYDVDVVPVGKDNQQHIEYCADVAQKFNARYGETFRIPKFQVSNDIGQIPGLDGRKMSKSYNNYLGMLDGPEILKKKINKIITSDLGPTDPKDPDTCNLYQILKFFLDDLEQKDISSRYKAGSISYKETKDILYDKLLTFLEQIQKKFYEISDQEVEDLLAKNAVKANILANAKIDEVYKKLGFRG